MWPAHPKKTDENRGWNSCHCGIPPVGCCHILAQQIQREGFPLWGESDLLLLGPHSCPLFPRRVGSEVIYCNHGRCWRRAGWSDWLLWICLSAQTPKSAASPSSWGKMLWMKQTWLWSKDSGWKKSSSMRGLTTVKAASTTTSVWTCLWITICDVVFSIKKTVCLLPSYRIYEYSIIVWFKKSYLSFSMHVQCRVQVSKSLLCKLQIRPGLASWLLVMTNHARRYTPQT